MDSCFFFDRKCFTLPPIQLFSSMDYIEITYRLSATGNTEDISEIVIALLALGFESFEESNHALKAYIPEEKFDSAVLHELFGAYPDLIGSAEILRIEQENWNSLWESNFPILRYPNLSYEVS